MHSTIIDLPTKPFLNHHHHHIQYPSHPQGHYLPYLPYTYPSLSWCPRSRTSSPRPDHRSCGFPAIQKRVWAVHNVRVSGNKVRKRGGFIGIGPYNRPNLNSQPSNGEPALQGPEHGAPDPQDSLTEEPAPEVSNFGSHFFPFLSSVLQVAARIMFGGLCSRITSGPR